MKKLFVLFVILMLLVISTTALAVDTHEHYETEFLSDMSTV